MAKKKNTADELQIAADKGDLAEVERLLPLVPLSPSAHEIYNALYSAGEAGHIPIVDRLIEATPALWKKRFKRDLITHLSYKSGTLSTIKHLVATGAEIQSYAGSTGYAAALSSENFEVAEYLKSQGAYWSTAALCHAAKRGDLKLAKEAIAAGALINSAQSGFHETPLIVAARKGHTEIIDLLLENGAEVNRKIHDKSALANAVSSPTSNLQIVNLLIDHGADLHDTFYGTTLLMQAAEGGNIDIVRRLIELGADANAKDKDSGKTVMDFAKDGKSKAVIDYLRTFGATADRDAGRTLAKTLAKLVSGKSQEHAGGYCFGLSGDEVLKMRSAFLINGKLDGRRCQLQVGSDGFTLVVVNLRFRHPELVIFADETVTLKSDSKNGGQPIIDAKGLTDEARNEFFRSPELFEKLALRGDDQIRFGHTETVLIASGTDPEKAATRLNTFREFLKCICKPPQKERRLFEKEWLLKALPKNSPDYKKSPHHFGGKLEADVACPFCKSDLTLMAALDFSDEALPKTPLKKLPVFWCLDCAFWEAAFFDLSDGTPRALPADRKQEKIGEDTSPLDVRPLTLIPVPAGKKAGRKNKLGGKPNWFQSDETPDCPKCEKSMAFALQLASDSHVTFADMGFLYAFVCPECQITASLVQSH